MADNDGKTIQESVVQTNRLVLSGIGTPKSGGSDRDVSDDALVDVEPAIPNSGTAYQQAVDKAVQSVAQTTALALQDASNMMRNVATVEVTAIGVATAKWIENPSNDDYKTIINASLNTITNAATVYTNIGDAVIGVLEQFDTVGSSSNNDNGETNGGNDNENNNGNDTSPPGF